MEEEYNEQVRKGKHLNTEERGQIETYLRLGSTISEIAMELGRAKSTISVEVRQGKYHGSYRANVAQNRAVKRRKESHKHSKWKDCELQGFVLKCLKKRWSPEVISATWERQTGQSFSHTSLYNLIKKYRPEWKKFLICKGKRRKLTHSASVGKIPNRVEISNRPEIVASRQRFGDYEADTVYSCRGGKSCLAVFVERQSRLYLLAKMKDKSADAMYKASRKLLKNKLVKTITYDNGTENVLHEKVNNLLNCNSFFATLTTVGKRVRLRIETKSYVNSSLKEPILT